MLGWVTAQGCEAVWKVVGGEMGGGGIGLLGEQLRGSCRQGRGKLFGLMHRAGGQLGACLVRGSG